jgi:hypothetical protein
MSHTLPKIPVEIYPNGDFEVYLYMLIDLRSPYSPEDNEYLTQHYSIFISWFWRFFAGRFAVESPDININ